MTPLEEKLLRTDRDLITSLIPSGSHILDLGCGDGSLLAKLMKEKGVTGHGVDIDEHNLILSIERGLSVCQCDLDEGLIDFPDKSYDYAILNQTLQAIKKPDKVIREMLRVGTFGIVGFPNAGYWLSRFQLLFKGRLPKTPFMPFSWFDTPNIHSLTIKDFKDFCQSEGIDIISEINYICGRWFSNPIVNWLSNLFALNSIFIIQRKE
jgi:methionine biosynthesis protein MetW